MAKRSSRRSSGAMAIPAVATGLVLQLLLTWSGVGKARATGSRAGAGCPGSDTSTPVYSYWSMCTNPVQFGNAYHIVTVSLLTSGLAPEWDETNSTWYVRASDDPSTYAIVAVGSDDSYVAQQDALILFNVDTNRSLSWRQEGDEYFLIEANIFNATSLQFAAADVALPCPLVLNAVCRAYDLVDYSAETGLSAYVDDGVTYYQKASDSLETFLLLNPDSAAISGGRPYS